MNTWPDILCCAISTLICFPLSLSLSLILRLCVLVFHSNSTQVHRNIHSVMIMHESRSLSVTEQNVFTFFLLHSVNRFYIMTTKLQLIDRLSHQKFCPHHAYKYIQNIQRHNAGVTMCALPTLQVEFVFALYTFYFADKNERLYRSTCHRRWLHAMRASVR